MPSKVIQEIKELISNGDEVDEKVALRLILAVQVELLDTVAGVNARLADTEKMTEDTTRIVKARECPSLTKIESDVACIKRTLDESEKNPSLLWLIKNKMPKTVGVILGVTYLMHMLFVYMGPFIDKVFAFLGVF